VRALRSPPVCGRSICDLGQRCKQPPRGTADATCCACVCVCVHALAGCVRVVCPQADPRTCIVSLTVTEKGYCQVQCQCLALLCLCCTVGHVSVGTSPATARCAGGSVPLPVR
jgi:hypothetical protein